MKNNPWKSGLKFLLLFIAIGLIVFIASQTFWGSLILFTSYFIFFIQFRKYVNKKEIEIKNKPIPDEKEIFNVDNFNQWFCDPNNGAVYAHLGIFLRLDKLSQPHIEDYIKTKYGIDNDAFMWSKVRSEMYYEFLEEIRKDWRNKLNNK